MVAGLIWGGSFLFVEYALTALTPIGVAFWRTTFGALAMLIAIFIYRSKLPTSFDAWRKMTIAGALMSSVPFTLFACPDLRLERTSEHLERSHPDCNCDCDVDCL